MACTTNNNVVVHNCYNWNMICNLRRELTRHQLSDDHLTQLDVYLREKMRENIFICSDWNEEFNCQGALTTHE